MTINKAYNQTMRDRCKEKQEDSENTRTPAEIKAERINAMVSVISAKVRTQFEREVQEFPELRYTLEERTHLTNEISSAVNRLIAECYRNSPKYSAGDTMGM